MDILSILFWIIAILFAMLFMVVLISCISICSVIVIGAPFVAVVALIIFAIRKKKKKAD